LAPQLRKNEREVYPAQEKTQLKYTNNIIYRHRDAGDEVGDRKTIVESGDRGFEIQKCRRGDGSDCRHSSGGGEEPFCGQANLWRGDAIKIPQTEGGQKMRRGKFRFLLVALFVASSLLCTGGEVRAATFQYGLTTPSITPTSVLTSQTYRFNFTQNGTLALGYVDLEIPEKINIPVGPFPSATSNTYFTVLLNGTGAPLSGEVYDKGIGDFGTKFGVGDTRYRVMKVNISSSSSFSLVLNIFNQVQLTGSGTTLGTEKGVVLIKAGNGSNTQSFSLPLYPEINTPAIVSLNGPTISNMSIFPNPLQAPECATVTWSGESIVSAYVSIDLPDPTATDCVIQPSPGTSSALLCFVDQGNYTITVVATGANSATSSRSTTLTVSPGPLLETTCKQIRKNPTVGNQTCINLCLTTINGVRQEISSADWYNTPDCSGEAVPLNIYGEDSPEKTLVCAPCLYPADPSHPQACTTNPDPNNPPFLYVQPVPEGSTINPYKNCDVFRFEQQDQGFAAVLGTDPWIVVNGRQIWVR